MHHIAPDTLHKTKTRLNPKRSQKADERHALTRTRDWGWQRAALSSLQSASQAPRLHLSPSPGIPAPPPPAPAPELLPTTGILFYRWCGMGRLMGKREKPQLASRQISEKPAQPPFLPSVNSYRLFLLQVHGRTHFLNSSAPPEIAIRAPMNNDRSSAGSSDGTTPPPPAGNEHEVDQPPPSPPPRFLGATLTQRFPLMGNMGRPPRARESTAPSAVADGLRQLRRPLVSPPVHPPSIRILEEPAQRPPSSHLPIAIAYFFYTSMRGKKTERAGWAQQLKRT